MLCGLWITHSFWVCHRCELMYGLTLPFCQWPRWAKQMKEDHQAARRSEKLRLRVEGDTGVAQGLYERRAYGEGNGGDTD